MPEDRTVPAFLQALGSSAPAPGGGAASALAGALAAALTEMVAQLTVGRPRFQAVDDAMRAVIAETTRARTELLALMSEDEQAFQGVSASYKLSKATDDERAIRDAAIQQALELAMQPPLRMMEVVCDVLRLASEMAASGNPTVASDAGCAALLGEAAVRAAGLNVLANVMLLRDNVAADQARMAMEQFEEQAQALRETTMASVHARLHG